MKIKILSLAILFCLILISPVYANSIIEIRGLEIPIIEGAKLIQTGKEQAAQARSTAYIVDKPLSEVISFYKSFLEENGFLFIGGEEDGCFNASVKKADAMFTLMIYSSNRKTILQFIW